ncbi:TM2 domain-containing protein [Erythrobacter sp. MTPC3]|uniref:TM2 domain-containing protein n=1 Tax=Erythrobacter sp. MTPC3 TaxID=3056564 RepID=UPI0036F40096
MASDAHTQMVYEANRKSVGLTYVLWLLLGWVGVHRLYAGATKSGIVQLLLGLSVVGLVIQIPWWLLDSVLIPGIVREKNLETLELMNFGTSAGSPAQGENAGPPTIADAKREAMLEDLRSTGYRKQRSDISHLYR